ncbi:hypothetical protein A2631_04975 [Candidatus Daviesbacteria bacterium RIFCSPHIGHO2_01_FULL_44_29]|uniref:Cardiolipin synthase N-terminal domain-containing protein n=1 Tax=Candidatus Daviesbacteria bacterium RIFCSPHIGHO2_02_FULL_43_12 TaxID=1797776 RepID=A0A1F5KGZ8_9BACT|nr:MAG: hypothetical protein A2631_04975 [Candidatus Daviesbacteria bacterium RIFCSPHIGHO2_01_FULL_44_29]OGE40075.1 MAG: hypothetical protein A3D25_04705 [Candidatus Daviesbacteria bacterium RIFCSPHIGHO2_02_FULL_43_12]OGE70245.1 MAG: hypothetical protein A3B55_00865 [Candidatus Daviesbacteria bacterium RIFCSPLOWO2_01_FULL_43_15]
MFWWLGIPLAIGTFMGLFGLAATVFWIWMLVDAIQRKFKDQSERLVWVLVIVFTHFAGALIYYFVVKANSKA